MCEVLFAVNAHLFRIVLLYSFQHCATLWLVIGMPSTGVLSVTTAEHAGSNCKNLCSFLTSQIPAPLFPCFGTSYWRETALRSSPLYGFCCKPSTKKMKYHQSFEVQCKKRCKLSTLWSCIQHLREWDLHLPFLLESALRLLVLGLCSMWRKQFRVELTRWYWVWHYQGSGIKAAV